MEAEALLLAHEMRLQKLKKAASTDSVSINLTSAPSTGDMSVSQTVPPSSESTPSGSGYPNSGRGRGGGRFGNIQCRVCFKFGHIATYCYHRFNQQFQPAIPHECHGQVGRDGLYEFPNLRFLPIHQLKPVPPLVLILVLVLALVYSPLLMYLNIYLVLLNSIGTLS